MKERFKVRDYILNYYELDVKSTMDVSWHILKKKSSLILMCEGSPEKMFSDRSLISSHIEYKGATYDDIKQYIPEN